MSKMRPLQPDDMSPGEAEVYDALVAAIEAAAHALSGVQSAEGVNALVMQLSAPTSAAMGIVVAVENIPGGHAFIDKVNTALRGAITILLDAHAEMPRTTVPPSGLTH